MTSRLGIAAGRLWLSRVGAAAAFAATLAIAGFYAGRVFMPLPIMASDEASYLIRALWPDAVVARDPAVPAITNGAHLSLIRAAYALGGPWIVSDRLFNAAAYFGGLLALWRACVRGLPRSERFALLLLALGFAYHRFALSNLAEGLFVGVAALICMATGRWWTRRPALHAVVAGTLCATLVLTKPHGLETVAALAALAAIEAVTGAGWRRLVLRAALFAAAFFVVGNLIQMRAQEPAPNRLLFFMSDFYAGALSVKPPPGAWGLGALELLAMGATCAVLAGPPMVIGLADLAGRRRAEGAGFQPRPGDLMLVLLVLALAAQVAMVAIFAMKVAGAPGETRRLWGRYFEFFAPMIWLAAAPALARRPTRPVALGAAAALVVGLIGLLAAFRAGIVLFPWDSGVMTAFFHPDPIRAPLSVVTPYRAISIAAVLACALALALRVRPALAGLGLILTLGLLSTWLDHVWVDPIVRQRNALAADAAVIRRALPPEPASVVLLAPDANEGHLGFLELNARPFVLIGPPAATPPAEIAGAGAAVVSGPDAPPGGTWRRVFRGRDLSLWRQALPSAP